MSDITSIPHLVVTAPGRVNLLGEHIDYNEGIVLPAAIDRAIRIEASPSFTSIVHLHALNLGESAAFSLDNLDKKIDLKGNPLPGWALYPAGVAWVLRQAGLDLHGFQAAYSSNLPIGAGLSSSAAVEVGFAILWQAFGGWEIDRVTLAGYCRKAENEYVGVNCGLMDQFAVANGVEGHAIYLDTRSLEWRPVPLPPDTSLIIADSDIPHSLAISAYNERRRSCELALSLLKPFMPGIHALRDVSPADLARYSQFLPDELYRRTRHVVEECARMVKAYDFLMAGDATGFGKLMIDGHASLRDLYQVSCPELDLLVEIAMSLPGCFGARLTGAGFGGCTINLVDTNHAHSFADKLKTQYRTQTGQQGEVYLCHASRGAWVEKFPA
jgi:galactokinase